MSINIRLEANEKKGAFHLEEDGMERGLMTFVWASTDKIIIDHTEVDPTFGGKGFGKMLVEAAVTTAREKGIKIIPLCPFAKKIIEKTPEFQDVL